MPKSSNGEKLSFGRSGRKGDNTVRSGGSSRKPVLVLRSRHFVAAAHPFCVSVSTWFTARRKKWPGSGAHAALEGDRSVPDRGKSRELKLKRRGPDVITRRNKDGCLVKGVAGNQDDLPHASGSPGSLAGAGGSHGVPAVRKGCDPVIAKRGPGEPRVASSGDARVIARTFAGNSGSGRLNGEQGTLLRGNKAHDGLASAGGSHGVPSRFFW